MRAGALRLESASGGACDLLAGICVCRGPSSSQPDLAPGTSSVRVSDSSSMSVAVVPRLPLDPCMIVD
jgi:hypothetical protein